MPPNYAAASVRLLAVHFCKEAAWQKIFTFDRYINAATWKCTCFKLTQTLNQTATGYIEDSFN